MIKLSLSGAITLFLSLLTSYSSSTTLYVTSYILICFRLLFKIWKLTTFIFIQLVAYTVLLSFSFFSARKHIAPLDDHDLCRQPGDKQGPYPSFELWNSVPRATIAIHNVRVLGPYVCTRP